MMKVVWAIFGAATLSLTAAPAIGQEARAPSPLLGKLVDCGKLAGDAEQLACYRREVAALQEAERKRDVILVDRAEVRRTKRSLFGLSLPRFRLFGNDEDTPDEPEFTRIDATLKGAQLAGNAWSFELDDGARWVQTDSEQLARTPRPGDRIRIRRAALGSFFANVGTAPAIRVRRVN